ncbi:MAG: hypothetical protein JNL13_14550 [Chitinophagaceae bacterium]|nr:hypothetical protein [Chitinophagaceae bacterium]
MKQTLVLLSLMALVSCKRDYTCKCTYTTKNTDSVFTESFGLPARKGHAAVRECYGDYARKYTADSVSGRCKLFYDN